MLFSTYHLHDRYLNYLHQHKSKLQKKHKFLVALLSSIRVTRFQDAYCYTLHIQFLLFCLYEVR